MCGIAGIFELAQASVRQLPHVAAMTRAMRHRGPDDEGYVAVIEGQVRHFVGAETPSAVRSRFRVSPLVSQAFEHRSILAMGHRRLSILDISPAGHQPMSDPRGRYWIVYNGEIYNFREIRVELELLGHRFKTGSDTEVILASYGEWQENCLSRFNGDFAFAIWDNEEQSLFCARDRIGIKPFYYTLDHERFIFASDIKTIIASGLYCPEPDPHGLYLAMAFGISPRPITAFRGVRALEQAHWMRVNRDGSVKKCRYWSVPVGSQDYSMTEAGAVGQLEEQLHRAVKLRLVADVPVGTFMSGGIDSTTISAIAAQYHPGIKAFTLGYQNDASDLDEVSQAEATSRLHSMQHIVERVDPISVLKDLTDRVKNYEEPAYGLGANYTISKLAKNNKVTVVLNGLGGDELFAGYAYYRYASRPRFGWLHPLTGLVNLLGNKKISRGVSLFTAQTADHLHTMLFSQADDNKLRNLFKSSLHPPEGIQDFLHNLYVKDMVFGDTVEAFGYMDLMNYIGNHHVHRLDQFTMAHSIEGRFPFLDHNLVELAYSIPSHLKMRGREQKYILRRVAEKYIATECLLMKKKGFGLPLKQWMRGPLKPLVIDSLQKLSQRSEVNGDAISLWCQAYEKNSFPHSWIWHLVILELWFQQFIDPGISLDYLKP